MATTRSLTFAATSRDFVTTLNKRVNDYFKTHDISRHANIEMAIKTIFMFGLYFGPYFLVITGVVTDMAWQIGLVIIMGLGLAGIGLSVMHDANHGAYSKRQWVNTTIGYSLNLIGANAFNWKIQHNMLHHSYTNVHEEDEDISPRGVLRLSPHSEWRYMHQFQFIYAWFLYGLMTLVWMVAKDFVRIIRYHKNGLARKSNADIKEEWMILLGTKILYVGYIFALPVWLTDLYWWQVLIGIFIMQYIAGFILAIIFQPAHVIEGTEYPLPDENRMLENNWAVHQLLTTTNFATTSRWFSWYVGGLNFQIEHHLFPNICHVHYRNIAQIVKDTALDFGLPYHCKKTFWEAIASHARLLKQLGKRPAPFTTPLTSDNPVKLY
ncbi:fatty acid desaturase family protein [Parachryseolinea silvisoli]|uniref:fatty acid desaturase family protein n=1 Tax=Parachryseolinea silvisoli TaxID=2873601 RepID=UPI002265F96F|nr:acyl-CoA desaturase [Parachryseolinea silvisoli]MCD9015173.1 acyl-CoA desaturase [Parachryseolinea silvisoli]